MIPEIEMPGHGLAALTAYPWLRLHGGSPLCRMDPLGHQRRRLLRGQGDDVRIHRGRAHGVLALFPSKLIHIGGDECPKATLEGVPLCQQRIARRLKDEYQLQSYFIHRIERWMHAHGREIIGWDEILPGRHLKPRKHRNRGTEASSESGKAAQRETQ